MASFLTCLWSIALPVVIAAMASALYDREAFGFGLIVGLIATPSVLLFATPSGVQRPLAHSLAYSLVVAITVGFSLFGLPAFKIIDAEPSAAAFAQFSLAIYVIAVLTSITCIALHVRFNSSRGNASP